MGITVEMLRIAIAGKPANAKVKISTCTLDNDGETIRSKVAADIYEVGSYAPEDADPNDASQIETVVLTIVGSIGEK
jgi:hypothetical protein